jgi:hypothetical protein
MAIFALGWRLRQVEGGRVSSDRGTGDGIGVGGVIYLAVMAALIGARYFGVLT